MKLYTVKAIATMLDMTERNVRKLRAKGVIREAKPGLYELVPTVNAYINYIRGADADGDTYTEARARLATAKAEAAENENRLRQKELHETGEIERAITVLVTNLRTRALAMPAKLTPNIVALMGDKNKIYDLLETSMEEMLTEMSKYENAFEVPEGEEDGRDTPDARGDGTAARADRKKSKVQKAKVRQPRQTSAPA